MAGTKPKPAPAHLEVASGKNVPSAATSPRDSEESYDLVSDQGGKKAKAATPAAPGTSIAASTTAAKPAAPAEDDEDSDWE